MRCHVHALQAGPAAPYGVTVYSAYAWIVPKPAGAVSAALALPDASTRLLRACQKRARKKRLCRTVPQSLHVGAHVLAFLTEPGMEACTGPWDVGRLPLPLAGISSSQ